MTWNKRYYLFVFGSIFKVLFFSFVKNYIIINKNEKINKDFINNI